MGFAGGGRAARVDDVLDHEQGGAAALGVVSYGAQNGDRFGVGVPP
jgi:hypothetical protein